MHVTPDLSPTQRALLREAGDAEARAIALDLTQLADRLDQRPGSLLTQIVYLESMGLMDSHLGDEEPAMLSNAGRQYLERLERDGAVDEGMLYFLAGYVDDLNAREALLESGAAIVACLRQGLLEGTGPQTAWRFLPPAFNGQVDAGLVLDLFAASVALMARLGAGVPAGCLAEENIAVTLIADATELLTDHYDAGELTEAELQAAKRALHGVYDLFGDADVTYLWDPRHPHALANAQLGVTELRQAGWFESWAAPIGSLGTTA